MARGALRSNLTVSFHHSRMLSEEPMTALPCLGTIPTPPAWLGAHAGFPRLRDAAASSASRGACGPSTCASGGRRSCSHPPSGRHLRLNPSPLT
ncbi:hypothetical protein NL676_013933 [Syzygium grande]|nr:hypothetical protein NL676_013933 [Syzygium grande]